MKYNSNLMVQHTSKLSLTVGIIQILETKAKGSINEDVSMSIDVSLRRNHTHDKQHLPRSPTQDRWEYNEFWDPQTVLCGSELLVQRETVVNQLEIPPRRLSSRADLL